MSRLQKYLLFSFLLHLLVACLLPLSNDEAYYWDWGRSLHLSFKDHPPGVSWLTFINQIFFDDLLAVRFMSPILSTLSLWLIFKTIDLIYPRNTGPIYRLAFCLYLFSPGLFLLGSIMIPDVGLVVALQALMYLLFKGLHDSKLGFSKALLAGLLLGIAGAFKYHALPLVIAMFLSFFWIRRNHLYQDLSFYVISAAVGILVCLPVWWWNYQHEFASFRFQFDHGFAGGSWNFLSLVQALFSVVLLVGPVVFYSSFRLAFKRLSGEMGLASIPLLSLAFIIFFAALRKPVLPHWLLPGFFLLFPFLSVWLYTCISKTLLRLHFFYGGAVLASVLSISVLTRFQADWLRIFDGDPGSLTEITVWPYLNESLQHALDRSELGDQKTCMTMMADRWYTLAQLSYYSDFEGSVRLLNASSFDFYELKNKDLTKECMIAYIIAPKQKLEISKIPEGFALLSYFPLKVDYHESQDWKLAFLFPKVSKQAFVTEL